MWKWFIKYFIPHPEHNDRKPYALRRDATIIMLVMIAGLELLFMNHFIVLSRIDSMMASVLPNAIINLTNDNRKTSQEPILRENVLLNKAAQAKADDMARKGYFAHVSPEGVTPWHWFFSEGYVFSKAGENLAVNFYESHDVVDAWMRSPSHRENILNKDFVEIGIGTARGTYQGKDAIFVVQMFGTPADTKIVSVNTLADMVEPKPVPKKTTVHPLATATPQRLNTKIATATVVRTDTFVSALDVPVATVAGASESASAFQLWLDRLFAQPQSFLTYLYDIWVLLVALPLLLSMFLEAEKRHFEHILYGLCVVIFLGIAIYVNQSQLALHFMIV